MDKLQKLLFALTTICSFFSCSNDDYYMQRLQEIKDIGDEDPALALKMEDSIYVYACKKSTYHKYKYDLLSVRLHDKADHIPESDLLIKDIVRYFDDNGTLKERQEAHYYAGSVYRDLQNTPKGLEHFLQSVDICRDNECDSTLLRNAYSNLHCLYFNVQDYENALAMAKKEYELSEAIGKKHQSTSVHMGVSLRLHDNAKDAMFYFDEAFKLACNNKKGISQETMISLMANYTHMGEIERAKKCLDTLRNAQSDDQMSSKACLAIGNYFKAIDKTDSASTYFLLALKHAPSFEQIYYASKDLFLLYRNTNNTEKALKYAGLFVLVSDTLNMGGRQQLAATVNNMYRYNRDKEAERLMEEENKSMRNKIAIAVILGILLTLVVSLVYYARRLKHLREVVELNNQIGQLEDFLKEKSQLLDKVKSDNQILRQERDNSMAVRNKNELLQIMKDTVLGKYTPTLNDWSDLYRYVDSLWPLLLSQLNNQKDKLTETQTRACCLYLLGLERKEVCAILGISDSTAWRWARTVDTLLEAANS